MMFEYLPLGTGLFPGVSVVSSRETFGSTTIESETRNMYCEQFLKVLHGNKNYLPLRLFYHRIVWTMIDFVI